MFNKKLKQEYEAALKDEVQTYNTVQEQLLKESENLYKCREDLKPLLEESYLFINSLRNTPEEIDLEIKKIKINLSDYNHLIDISKQEIDKELTKTGAAVGAGVATGVAVTAMAPTAVMGIATTFGVASTGTAISAISGAAATNAALAWIGGGALAAGGGGMAAGSAFLALAGPIGWGIAGVSVLGGTLSISGKNKKAAVQALASAASIRAQYRISQGITTEITRMIQFTKKNKSKLSNMLKTLRDEQSIKDYAILDDDSKYLLGSFVNNVLSSTVLLNGVIGDNGKFVSKDDPEKQLLSSKKNSKKSKYDQKKVIRIFEKHPLKIVDFHFLGNMPTVLLNNGINNIAPDVNKDNVLAISNSSLTSKFKSGFLITKDELIVNESLSRPYRILLTDIKNVSADGSTLTFTLHNSDTYTLTFGSKKDSAACGCLLKELVNYMKS